jgi:hypothetical protein
MSPIQQMLLGVGAVATKTYVDDLYSTFVYKGNGNSTRQIQNGLDLATEGGLVWLKDLGQQRNHYLFDSASLAASTYNQYLSTNTTSARYSSAGTGNGLSGPFLTNGFTTGNNHNQSNRKFATFSFRKAPGFFDIQTWTGDNNTNRAISHNLESVPGMIIVKNTSNSFEWNVWHRSIWDTSGYKSLRLNTDDGKSGRNAFWGVSAPTSSNFYVRSNGANVSGQTYVAYIFGHDEQNYGVTGSESIIKCGSMTLSSGEATVNLGWEPQFLMIKRSDGEGDWVMYDAQTEGLRYGDKLIISANHNTGQYGGNYPFDITPTGFKVINGWALSGGAGTTEHIYIAIRRPDGAAGRPIELATKVFAMDTGSGSNNIPNFDSGFPVDFCLTRKPASSDNWYTGARLLGTRFLKTNSNSAKSDSSNFVFDSSFGWNNYSSWGSNEQSWMFRRHAGLDVVLYEGNSVSGTQINHSLNAVPQMIWIKRWNGTQDWQVGHYGANGGSSPWNYYLELNSIGGESSQVGIWNNTAPTSTHFTVGNWTQVNNSSGKYMAILFTSTDVSKVGYYTGNGNSTGPNITTGFAPRLVIIKCTSANTYWYLFDTFRGISYSIALQENASQDSNSNYITVNSTGFQPTTTFDHINGNNEIYTYYAHA